MNKYYRFIGGAAGVIALFTFVGGILGFGGNIISFGGKMLDVGTNTNASAAAKALEEQKAEAAKALEKQKAEAAAALERHKAEVARITEIKKGFSTAIDNINSRDVNSRNSAIRNIENNWKDIMAESPEKQWLTVEALASSITTYPLVDGRSAKDKKDGIQMALNILKSRNPEDDNKGKAAKEGPRIIGLVKTNLRDYDLSNGQFPKAAFNKSILDNATLTGANLKGSYISGSSLKGANLKNVDLSKAEVRGTDLSGADLSGANLADSDLTKTDFHRANLKNVNLTRSNITEQQIMQSCNWRLAEDSSGKIENLKQNHVYRKKSGCERFE
jgi:uncharacterized protein YjbI with pentapeptide repeats